MNVEENYRNKLLLDIKHLHATNKLANYSAAVKWLNERPAALKEGDDKAVKDAVTILVTEALWRDVKDAFPHAVVQIDTCHECECDEPEHHDTPHVMCYTEGEGGRDGFVVFASLDEIDIRESAFF